MKRTLEGIALAGEEVLQQAIDAMRCYHDAKDSGADPVHVERLRQIAESAFQAATDYQLHALGHQPLVRH